MRPSAVTIAMRAEISLLGRALRLSINETRIGFVGFGSGTPSVFNRARLVSIDDRSRDVASSAASEETNCSNAVRGSTDGVGVSFNDDGEVLFRSRIDADAAATTNLPPHSLQNFAEAGLLNPHGKQDLVVMLASDTIKFLVPPLHLT